MSETMLDRVEKRLIELGLSDRAVGMLATNNPDMIRDMRRRGTVPKRGGLDGLAEALETTVEYLLHGRSTGAVIADRRTGYDGNAEPEPFGKPLPRTLPVHGTALGGEVRFDGEADAIETHVVEPEVIDWVRRPPSLDGRKDVYALYITGTSMEPRFEPGDPVIVDSKRAPKPGDDVIVQIMGEVGDDHEVKAALIKRLVRRTSKHVELRQYNPAMTFIVPLDRVIYIHRVLAVRDMIG